VAIVKRLAMLLVLLECGGHAAAMTAAAWPPHSRTLPQYIAALQGLRANPAEATALIGSEIDSPAGRFHADDALLGAIARKDKDAQTRLDATIAALQQTSATTTTNTDRQLLERLRREEQADELRRGGEVALPEETNATLLHRIAEWVRKGFEWLGEKIVDFFEWLSKWWPKSGRRDVRPRGLGGVPFLVTALTIAIVAMLAVLALEVLRRSRKEGAPELAASDPIASRRDEDPLSRGANEWERYAAQLAAAGRIREAIRAWYHAVLVTCYGAGVLHFRKGRTNWEYVSLLRADVAWRPLFIELTRRFEREWYGRDESTPEALDDCARRARGILDALHRGVAA
jgi:Domain of unknown function (DUF4129)